MSYKTGNRTQQTYLPPAIEDYIGPEDPVRVYDAFVDSLDFNFLGLTSEPQKGAESYCPKKMLKLIIYGISYGVNSSRKLERACNHNLSFIWLLSGLKPDYRTIARFRRNNKQAIQKVLKQCVRMCIDFDLIDGNILFVDGSKIRANASIKNTWTEKKCDEMLNKVDQKIDALIEEGESIDEQEEGQQSLVKATDVLKDQEKLKSKIKDILKKLETGNKNFLNTTDSDCANMKSIHGSHASYNVQNVVDEKHGLIVNTDVVNENSDINQFAVQTEQANEALGKKCAVICSDSGYANTTELEKIDSQNIKVIVPSQRQALHKEEKPFSKSQFIYDKEHNQYICPEGQVLKYRGINTKKQHLSYSIQNPGICKQCKNYNTCTDSKFGRRIIRLINEATREKLEKQYDEPKAQEIYKLRKQKAELPFGHYKHNLRFRQFLMRGKEYVKAEASLLATCFNIVRMITIIGVTDLIFKLKYS